MFQWLIFFVHRVCHQVCENKPRKCFFYCFNFQKHTDQALIQRFLHFCETFLCLKTILMLSDTEELMKTSSTNLKLIENCFRYQLKLLIFEQKGINEFIQARGVLRNIFTKTYSTTSLMLACFCMELKNWTLSSPVCLNIVLAARGKWKTAVMCYFRDGKSIIMVFSCLVRLSKHYIEAYYRMF